MLKLIIFDFDGTIADSAYYGIQAINELAPEFGLDPLTTDQIRQVKNFSARKMIKDSGLPFYKLPQFVYRLQEKIFTKIRYISTSVRIQPTLIELKKCDYMLGILTSNTKRNVNSFMELKNLNYFDFIYSDHSIFGKSKLLKKILRAYQIMKSESIYIGDEVRDIKACKKAGIPIIACTWGLNSKELLIKELPEYVAEKPSDIIRIIHSMKADML